MTYSEARNELDIPFIINQVFLGYKYLKREGKLYEKDSEVPTKLIQLYYNIHPGDVEFNIFKKSFMTKYVKNESNIEGVNDSNIHNKMEIAGLVDMYEYLYSKELDEDFNIYSLNELNKKLFIHTPFPEYAGSFRNEPCTLAGTAIDVCDYSMISREIYFLSKYVDELHKRGKTIRKNEDIDALIKYIDECVELKCKLIWIHPFKDGNGRTIRAFINKLFEDAGLPPVYIKTKERDEYQKAMKLAIGDNDYTAIKTFYKYKICDSLIELDINDRIKNQVSNGKKKVKTIENSNNI